ncbi:unnamed protein product [Alternaria alternata]
MESYEQACVAVAAALHIIQVETGEDNAKELVKEHLSADQAGPWLLVLDNADDHDILYGTEYTAGIIDYLPESERGMTVFTTRVQELAVSLTQGDVLELGSMSKPDATNFLEKSLITKSLTEDREAVEGLLDELAFLPLAIAQAAAYLNMNRTTITKYLRLLRHTEQDTISLISKEFRDQTRYKGSANAVVSTWVVSFSQLRERDAVAADLLAFMSCIEWKAIPQPLLPKMQSQERIEEAISTLYVVQQAVAHIAEVFLSDGLSPRPHQSVLEPLTAQTRGAPRRNEASTRRDPSAFERHVPPSIPHFQPYYETQGQTLAEALRQVSTSVTISIPTSAPDMGPVTTCISVSIPAPAPLPPPTFLRSSPPVAIAVSVTAASQPAWQPPTLEEFLADIAGRRSQPVLDQYNDMMSATNFLAQTGQQDDPAELVEARNMALATEGLFASCTPTMAWNYHFGDMNAFYSERFEQVDAQNAIAEPQHEPQHEPRQRPKRAAAAAASEAWKDLGPRKRTR